MTPDAPPAADAALNDAEVEAVLDALRSGWLTMGPRIQELERMLADRFGAPHALALSSGTAALQLALLGAGVGAGDEVIVPALSFEGAAAAIAFTGASPVACDVRGVEDPTIDPGDAAARITPRTRAIVAVHLLGAAADLAPLRALCDERGIALVEHAAHATGGQLRDGAPAGSVGDAACWSLAADTPLGVGEGGFLTTARDELAARARSLRSHAMTSVTWDRHRGHANTYDIVDLGYNFRLDEPRAALAHARLERLGDEVARRRALVRDLRERLARVAGVTLPWDEETIARSSPHRFAFALADAAARDAVRRQLAAAGIESAPVALDAAGADAPPRAAEAAARTLTVALGPAADAAQAERLADAVQRALA